MSFAGLLIGLNALVFVAYGVAFAIAPVALSLFVTESAPGSTSGIIDMRSTYGGMSIGLGILLGLMARDPGLHGLGLRSVIVVMVFMASSRLLGIALDGRPNGMMWAYLVAEVLVVVLAAWALQARREAA